MLKQGVVQETLAELNGAAGGVLPPLHNLPHWSRVNNFDKARYPKPFLKDRLQPVSKTDMDGATSTSTHAAEADMESESQQDVAVEVMRGSNPAQRVVHLERSIQFLQQQHYEVLSNLHEEIDKLKRENKELHFRVVMLQKSTSAPGSAQSRKGSSRPQTRGNNKFNVANGNMPMLIGRMPHPPSASKSGMEDKHSTGLIEQQSQGSDEKVEDLKIIFLEEEIKDLKKALKEETNRNHYLQQLLDAAQKQATAAGQSALSVGPVTEHKSHSSKHPVVNQSKTQHVTSAPSMDRSDLTPPHSAAVREESLPFNATLNPLRVHTGHHASRVPTLQECEVIIKHLQRLSDNQAHELNQLKSDLRDVLYSHKWTPEAFLLAKAYIAEDDAREMAEQNRLPRIALKQNSRKVPDVAYLQKDALSLPALKQTLGNKAIERRKRTQILHKSRLSGNKEVAN